MMVADANTNAQKARNAEVGGQNRKLSCRICIYRMFIFEEMTPVYHCSQLGPARALDRMANRASNRKRPEAPIHNHRS